jgi:hypothetical protein
LWGFEDGKDVEEVLSALEGETSYAEGVLNKAVERDSGSFAYQEFAFLGEYSIARLVRQALEIAREEGVTDARTAVARYELLSYFYNSAGRHVEFKSAGGSYLQSEAVVSVGAYDWACYELAHLYGATSLKTCENERCGILFAPKPSHRRFCSTGCQDAVKKRRRRAARDSSGR